MLLGIGSLVWWPDQGFFFQHHGPGGEELRGVIAWQHETFRGVCSQRRSEAGFTELGYCLWWVLDCHRPDESSLPFLWATGLDTDSIQNEELTYEYIFVLVVSLESWNKCPGRMYVCSSLVGLSRVGVVCSKTRKVTFCYLVPGSVETSQAWQWSGWSHSDTEPL